LFNAWPFGDNYYYEYEYVTSLSSSVRETSGLIRVDGRIITQNDSGGEPKLFELDTLTGEVLRTVVVANAENYDWEDLAQDSLYIYIGDIGNNNGNRKDLKIYRILKQDYIQSDKDTVYSEVIGFQYKDQKDFSPKRFSSNYDAEGLIATKDSLYIFSKNWINFKTYLYVVPKIPGNYDIRVRDSLNVEGLITGATYDWALDRITLSGYTLSSNFIVNLSNFKGDNFFDGKVKKYLLELEGSKQTEGICLDGRGGFFLSGEKTSKYPATLYRLYSNPAVRPGRK
jgi:hypothetical protein